MTSGIGVYALDLVELAAACRAEPGNLVASGTLVLIEQLRARDAEIAHLRAETQQAQNRSEARAIRGCQDSAFAALRGEP
jgi:hypothetical protein